jgi:adenosine kinase
LLGEAPRIVATIGSDGTPYLDAMKACGVSVDGIEMQNNVFTAVGNIMTDQADNQITAFYMGAMARETHLDLASLPDPKNTMVVLSAGNKQDMLRYATQSKQLGIPYMFDPGQTIPFLTPEEMRTLINGAHIFITNDYELQMVLNRTGLTLEQLQSQVRMVVTTLGSKGSTFWTKDGTVAVAACRVNTVVDPTGAGDAFRAGVLKGLAQGCSIEQLGRLGAASAAYVVETYGTQEHRYTSAEFAKRYEDNFTEACPTT